MIKVKTHSGAKKRFKKLKSGLIKASKSFRRHLLSKKSSNRKRRLRKPLFFEKCDMRHIVSLLPY